MFILRSDRDGTLIGQLAQMVSNEYGISHKVEVALGAHACGVERKNRFLNQAIEAAESEGELNSAQQLELLVALTQTRVDQVMESDGSTPFERRHGVQPITAQQMMSAHMRRPRLW